MPDKITKGSREEKRSVSVAIPIDITAFKDVEHQYHSPDDGESSGSDQSSQTNDDEDDARTFATQSSAPTSFFSRSSTPPLELDGELNLSIEEEHREQTFHRSTQNSSAFFENLDENDPAFYDNAFLQLRFLDTIDPIFEMDEEVVQFPQDSYITSTSSHQRNESLSNGQVTEIFDESIDRLSKTV